MTRKEITNNFNKVFSVGYCELHYLLRYCNRVGYNSGIYGWNYDVYALDNGNIAICTGYRGKPGKPIDYKIIRIYEKKAEKIIKEYPYNEHKKRINKLLQEFINKIQLY